MAPALITLRNTRQIGALVGGHLLVVMISTLGASLPVVAQTKPSSLDEIGSEAREAFRAAKTKEQVDRMKQSARTYWPL